MMIRTTPIKYVAFAVSLVIALHVMTSAPSYHPAAATIVRKMEPTTSISTTSGLSFLNALQLPPICQRVVINVGSNRDPPISQDTDTCTIAVEPILKTASLIKPHPRLWIIPVAVSDTIGFAKMNVYNKDGASSSLAPANDKLEWSKSWAHAPKDYQQINFVPVIPLSLLLESIPSHIEIVFLKTDMQSYDLRAVKSAEAALKQCHSIYSEVYCHGFQTYAAADNDMANFELLIPQQGFTTITNPCQGTPKESNAHWVHSDKIGQPQYANENAVILAPKW
jgi:FkbM family methyltransferase